MDNLLLPVAFLLLLLVLGASGAEEATPEKIVIHIPYKIQHHHHTHTNYKVITVPKTEEEEKQELTTPRDIETATEAGAPSVEANSIMSTFKSTYEPPKLRTYVRVKESTSLPLLEYLGLNKLFGTQEKPSKPKKLEIIHDEPVVEHLLHGPWNGFQVQSTGTELKKFQPEVFESYQFGTDYNLNQYKGEGLKGYEEKLGGDDNFAKFSIQKPVYEPAPSVKSTVAPGMGYLATEEDKQTKAISEAVQKVFEKHLYKDFPELKKGKVLKLTGQPQPHKPLMVPNGQGKGLSLTPITVEKEATNLQHIGFLVVGENNTPKFIGLDGKETTTR